MRIKNILGVVMIRDKVIEKFKSDLDLRNKIIDKVLLGTVLLAFSIVGGIFVDRIKSDLSYSNIYAKEKLEALLQVNEKLGDLFTSYTIRHRELRSGSLMQDHADWNKSHEDKRAMLVEVVNQKELLIAEIVPNLQFVVVIHDILRKDDLSKEEFLKFGCMLKRTQEYSVSILAKQVRPVGVLEEIYAQKTALVTWINESLNSMPKDTSQRMKWMNNIQNEFVKIDELECKYI
ncbi:hypothetical protein [Neptuniibacter sp. QD48_11]|uniref:hypothetical protein n=1 Tax=Neptuniibacter sp. QD48_11 TaxID=3398211 RepID=UPI0039F45D08